jgi:hypothetical protein
MQMTTRFLAREFPLGWNFYALNPPVGGWQAIQQQTRRRNISMGMDVYGRRFANEWAAAGQDQPGCYFRANVWSWRPIHDLMRQLCSDFLDEEMLLQMSFNDGAGPEDQQTCDEIAMRFSQWMEHNIDGHEVDHGMRVDGEGKFVDLRPKSSDETGFLAEAALVASAQARFGAQGVDGVRSPHSVDDESLKEWIEFLRHCGGFRVF